MRKIQYLFVSIIILFIGVFFACNGENNRKKTQEEQNLKELKNTFAFNETLRKESYSPSYKDFINQNALECWNQFPKKLKGVIRWYGSYQNNFLYLNVENTNDDSKQRSSLYNLQGEVLISNKNWIGNIGKLHSDLLEFKENNQFGLYHLRKKTTLFADFSWFIPSKIEHFVAFGMKKNQLYGITDDFELVKDTIKWHAASFEEIAKRQIESPNSNVFLEWIGISALDDLTKSTDEIELLSVPSSFLAYCKLVVSPIQFYFSTDDTTFKIVEKKENPKRVSWIVNCLKSYGNTRGILTSNYHLISQDKTRKSIKSYSLLIEIDEYTYQMSNEHARSTVKFINDSTIEVKAFLSSYRWGDKQAVDKELLKNDINAFVFHSSYESFTRYSYFHLNQKGDLTPYEKGNFEMASRTILTKKHFKGSFSRKLTKEEVEKLQETNQTNDFEVYLEFTDHLNLYDLKIMRNEIYARYGLIFKDKNLTNYFKQFNWYKPTKYNVDGYLTDLEKTNIAFIKQEEKELTRNPKSYIHSSFGPYALAG